MNEILLAIILVFMIISAIAALFTGELLSSVISLGAVGFGGSIAYLILGAPDLAITQVVVEVVTLVLLIRVTIGVGLKLASGRPKKQSLIWWGVILSILGTLGVMALHNFPPFGISVMDRLTNVPSLFYIVNSLPKTGASNLVTGILLDFRAYDTLGEATVIFTSVFGGLVLLRKKGKVKDDISGA